MFDEYIFCDTGSTDNTLAMAQAIPDIKVVHFTWIHDFAAARNFATSHATCEYIAWTDLDDGISNPAAFLKWRDNAMQFSQYWLAPYHYAMDAQGNPTCSFMRERCWRRDLGLTWNYFIHEGVAPHGPRGQASANVINTWAIQHHRTLEDLAKDKGRNLAIFKNHLSKDGKLDARMSYYYGKELFEAGEHAEAATELAKACVNEKLEFHDRVLCYQYAVNAFQKCNQWDRALAFAKLGLELAPQRAEFWVAAADSYVKLNRFHDAMTHYAAARRCENSNQDPKQAGLIFTLADAYGPYPTNMLIRCLCQLGRFDEAEKEAKEAVAKWDNPESKLLLIEIGRIKNQTIAYKNAKDCEDIVFTCPGGLYEWDSDLMQTKGFGGSEQACIYMAKHLKELSGRNVLVFNVRGERKLCEDGVQYIPFGETAGYFAENKPHLHIAWRHAFKITDAPTFVWSHDLMTPGAEHGQNYNKYLCLSEFHKQYVTSMFGIPEDKVIVTSNGIDSAKFKDCSYDALIDPVKKNPLKIVFPNSPDRGLEKVIRILDIVRDDPAFPVELFVFYGFGNMRKMGLNKEADQYEELIRARPWIHAIGNVTHAELLKHYEDAALWVYPTDFLETSCITAMECVAKGVYPIVRKWGALPDTLKEAAKDGMCQLIDRECVSEMQHDMWARSVKRAIEEKAWTKVKVDSKLYDWSRVAQSWLDILPKS